MEDQRRAVKICNLAPLQHMKLNAIVNLALMIVFIICLSLKHWFSFRVNCTQNSEFSLREVNMGEGSDWKVYGDFKGMCTEENLRKYSDLVEDCIQIGNFELAGIMVDVI